MERAECLCGGVVVNVKGVPLNSRYCHCKQCQKATASAFFARVLFNQSDVKIVGKTKSYSSSPELDRVSCSRCKTPIAALRKDGSVVGIALELFDGNAYPATEHTWVSEGIGIESLRDGLLQYAKGKVN